MALVLLHPLPLDETIWPAEIARLDARVISPTLYELGDSLEAWASAVLDLVGPEPMVIVGNSIGGSCAIEVARLAPERVRVIVLAGAKPGHRRDPELRDQALRVLATEGVAGAWTRYWAPLFAPNATQRSSNRHGSLCSGTRWTRSFEESAYSTVVPIGRSFWPTWTAPSWSSAESMTVGFAAAPRSPARCEGVSSGALLAQVTMFPWSDPWSWQRSSGKRWFRRERAGRVNSQPETTA